MFGKSKKQKLKEEKMKQQLFELGLEDFKYETKEKRKLALLQELKFDMEKFAKFQEEKGDRNFAYQIMKLVTFERVRSLFLEREESVYYLEVALDEGLVNLGTLVKCSHNKKGEVIHEEEIFELLIKIGYRAEVEQIQFLKVFDTDQAWIRLEHLTGKTWEEGVSIKKRIKEDLRWRVVGISMGLENGRTKAKKYI